MFEILCLLATIPLTSNSIVDDDTQLQISIFWKRMTFSIRNDGENKLITTSCSPNWKVVRPTAALLNCTFSPRLSAY